MPTIYLIRHAQASFGPADYDVLSDLGYRQCELLDAALAARGARPSRVLSGSLRRQQDTARACALLSSQTTLEVDPRWNEYDSAGVMAAYGNLVGSGAATDDGIGAGPGLSSRDFQAVLDKALARWIEAGDRSACAESWPVFSGRARAAITELAAGLGRGEEAMVVSSGGTIAAITEHLLGAGPPTFTAINRMSVNTSVSTVLSGRSGLNLLTLNEHTHLATTAELLTYR
jgi:broad specificity phosphatase PhoE